MYRCRRFFVIFLSLGVIASFFSFSVFADDHDNVTQGNLSVQVEVDGTSYNIDVTENVNRLVMSNPSVTKQFNVIVKSITWANLAYPTNNTFVSFKIGFAEAVSANSSYCIYPVRDFLTVNTQLGSIYSITDQSQHMEWFEHGDNVPNFRVLSSKAFIKAQFKEPRTINFNSANIMRCESTPSGIQSFFYLFIYDVQILPNVSWFMTEILNYQNYLLNQMISLVNYTHTFLQRFSEIDEWEVTNDFFDEDGNFVSSQSYLVDWQTAIYQLLTNLYAPVKAQAEQEQRAREAGALDALDDAYDKADDKLSFWSFLDLIDIGDIGEYDDDALGDAGSDSIIDWFSNATKNDIEGQVINPLSRDPEDEVIDFYGQNIEQIQSYFGGG